MLQIRFTANDLSKVRFAVSPLHQAVFLSMTPRSPETPDTVRRHRHLLRGVDSAAQPFFDLAHSRSRDFPDFLLPPPPPGGKHLLADALDAVAVTPEWRIAHDLGQLADQTSPTAQRLLDGGATIRRKLRNALTAVHHGVIGDSGPAIDAMLDAEVTKRAIQLATHGVDQTLATLHPAMIWRNPVLTIHVNQTTTSEFVLGGRGLVLLPMVGRDITVMATINPWEPAAIAYPAYPTSDDYLEPHTPLRDPGQPPRALIDLIGRTRARVLAAINATATPSTTQLAIECGISISSASEHTAVLRRAGLITSFRRGEAVVHVMTPHGLRTLSTTRSP